MSWVLLHSNVTREQRNGDLPCQVPGSQIARATNDAASRKSGTRSADLTGIAASSARRASGEKFKPVLKREQKVFLRSVAGREGNLDVVLARAVCSESTGPRGKHIQPAGRMTAVHTLHGGSQGASRIHSHVRKQKSTTSGTWSLGLPRFGRGCGGSTSRAAVGRRSLASYQT